MANFRKQKITAKLVRTNRVYPLAHTGMVLCFVDPSTMVFGSQEAVTKALDARDGMAAGMLTNAPMMDAMQSVDSEPLWSILDKTGTQTMMKQVLGEAGSVTDFESVTQAPRVVLVRHEFPARREIRPDHRYRRLLRRRYSFFAAFRCNHLQEDERRRNGKGRAGSHRYQLEFRPAERALCHLGQRLQRLLKSSLFQSMVH